MKVLTTGLDELTVGFLQKNGIVVEQENIESVEEFEGWFADDLYDAGIVDLDASSLGIYVARGLRAKLNNIPLVGISLEPKDTSWSNHRAMFLENGGDELLHNPANPRELIASLRALTRRFKGALLDIVELQVGEARLKVNHTTLSATINGIELELTGKELMMLLVFASAPGRVFSKEQLIRQMYVSGIDDEPEQKIIDVFVCKLRRKLSDAHTDAEHFIETVWGRGYKLADQAKKVAIA